MHVDEASYNYMNEYVYCDREECLQHTIPRYQCALDYDGNVITETYIIGTYHVHVAFYLHQTEISKMDVVLKFDTIKINQLIPLNFEDTEATLKKIKTIVTFS